MDYRYSFFWSFPQRISTVRNDVQGKCAIPLPLNHYARCEIPENNT